MQNADAIWRLVEAKQQSFSDLSDRIWDSPELNFEEFRSSAEHGRMIEAEGFDLLERIAGMPTAVGGEAGKDGPVIAILGEYDALPGLSQAAGISEPRPVRRRQWSWLRAQPSRRRIASRRGRRQGLAGREATCQGGFDHRVPCRGRRLLQKLHGAAGVFDDVDIAICWLPGPFTGVTTPLSLACNRGGVHFRRTSGPRRCCAASRPQRARRRRTHECGRQLSA